MGRGKHKLTIGREYFQRLAEARAAEAARRQAHADQVEAARRKRRPKCTCGAYPWPHRPAGGLCRFPDPPTEVWQGQAGKNAPTGARRHGSIKRRLMKRYGLHPIRDRAKVRRFLPKLYTAWCRRYGGPWAYWWLGGYVPAMLVTEHGAPREPAPYNGADFWAVVLDGTSRRWS